MTKLLTDVIRKFFGIPVYLFSFSGEFILWGIPQGFFLSENNKNYIILL